LIFHTKIERTLRTYRGGFPYTPLPISRVTNIIAERAVAAFEGDIRTRHDGQPVDAKAQVRGFPKEFQTTDKVEPASYAR